MSSADRSERERILRNGMAFSSSGRKHGRRSQPPAPFTRLAMKHPRSQYRGWRVTSCFKDIWRSPYRAVAKAVLQSPQFGPTWVSSILVTNFYLRVSAHEFPFNFDDC